MATKVQRIYIDDGDELLKACKEQVSLEFFKLLLYQDG